MLLVLAVCAAHANAQLSPEEALQAFEIAGDVRIELVAAEPLVASPCALAFDEKGGLFVAENRGYPDTANPAQGVIARLEDTDGDGRMDKRTVFAQGLTFPNGVLAWRGGVIVTCAPDVLFLKDTDGDGVADERRVLLSGFAVTGSTQLRVNAPTLGPDGWIYLAAGLSGGSISCPEHPERAPLKMTADVRFDPETLVVENVDGRSQFGQSFDEFGRRFICMNRLPVQHVVLSSKWLARNPRLAFSETVQDCNERSVRTGLSGGGDGVQLFPISANITTADSHAGSFSAACGVHLWRGGAMPARYNGCAFSCDPTGNLIHVDRLEARGGTFGAVPLLEGREFLASRDDCFRPVFLSRGNDGALYVADFYRKTIEHPEYLPEEVRKHTDFETGKSQGRIWRIVSTQPAGAVPALPAFRDEFAQIKDAIWEEAAVARLCTDPNPRVRLNLALALGDSRAPFAVPALARLALGDMQDRWMRAAVLSGVAGREAEFLRVIWPMLKGGTAAELLSGLGRSFADPGEALQAIDDSKISGSAMAALLIDVRGVEKSERFQGLLQVAALMAVQQEKNPAERLLFVRLLGRGSWRIASAPLIDILGREGYEPLRVAALRSLVAVDGPRAMPVLLAPGAWERYNPALRETLLNAVLAREPLLGPVLDAVESGALPAAAFNASRRQLFLKNADGVLRERAAKVFVATESAGLAEARAALALAGKAKNGRAVFKTHCAMCHRLDREGVAVGPDLFDMRRQPKENILFHIVVPEAEVAPAFAAYLCGTRDGRFYMGILSSDTATSVTLRLPGGLQETVLRAEMKSFEALPGSLMPAGLVSGLPLQDLADLLAFLKGEQ